MPTVVPLLPGHLPAALGLSQAAGWPHTLADWAMALSLSHGLAILEDDRLVAAALVTPFGPVATVNRVLVTPDRQGRGLGRRLMEEALSAQKPAEWRLIATDEGRPLYEKFGFAGSGTILQLQGLAAPKGAAEPLGDGSSDGLAPISVGDLDAVAAVDRRAGGHERRALLAAFLAAGSGVLLRQGGEITGFVLLRPFGRGEVAGPVVAATPDDARRLLHHVLASRAGSFLRVDTDEATGLAPFLIENGLALAGTGLRMSLGALPDAAETVASPTRPPRTFALAAQAYG